MPKNETFVTKPIKDLEGLNFFVDHYQRGYKWTVQQVFDLLNDISEYEPRKSTSEELKAYVNQFDFDSKPTIEELLGYINKFQEDFYCLQPVVVKKRTDEQIISLFKNGNSNSEIYEVIDGQQRLTTIYIILKILQDNPLYKIRYQTRDASAEFLENINKILSLVEIPELKNAEKLDDEINNLWNTFIQNENHKKYDNIDNIDNFFFTSAYIAIKSWLTKNQKEKEKLLKNILTHTKIIWYEVKDINIDSRDIFSNLNMGKISLTNAELIKALFLLKRTNEDNKIATELMQREIAAEWDRIENTLQSDKFWHFLTPEKNTNPTRIELIFNLISEKKSNKKEDHFHAFRFFDKKFKENHDQESPLEKIENSWNNVNSYFLMFKEWYEDRELYHLIGYITTIKIKNPKGSENLDLEDIIKLYRSEKLTKSDFRNRLKKIIKDDFKQYLLTSGEENNNDLNPIDNLNYEEHPSLIKKILLLFNILTSHNYSQTNRFDFQWYNHQHTSLEHIHAQNSELLNTKEQWLQWFKEAKTTIMELGLQEESLEKEIDSICHKLSIPEKKLMEMDDLEPLFRKITELFQDEGVENTHELYNLTLLDKSINSSLNNAIFPKKRERILEQNKEKNVFIPPCTLNVFLKRYSKSTTHFHYWGIEDRMAYRDEMSHVLSDFILFPNLQK